MNKITKLITNKKVIGLIIAATICCLGCLHYYNYYNKTDEVVLKVALYSGNSWGVPQSYAYRIYDEAARSFQKIYKDKKVKIEYKTGIMYNAYSEWFANMVIKGEEPDVFLILEEDFSTYAQIGLFENLTPYMKRASDFDREAYYQKALEAGQHRGRQYSLPMSIVPSFMIVNKTMMQKEGIHIDKEHWTWDEFYNICKAVTKDCDNDGNLDQFGVYGYEWDHAFYTNDKKLFSDDGTRVAFDEKLLHETITFLKKMYKLNHGTVVKESDFDKGNVAFKTFNLSEYRAYGTYPYRILKYEKFDWEAIPFPKGPNGESTSKLYTVQLGISSRSHNKQVAFDFIKFLTNNEAMQQKIWEETYNLPANRKVVEKIYQQSNYENPEVKFLNPEFLNTIITNSYIDPDFKLYSYLDELIGYKIFNIIARDKDIDTGIKELKMELEKALSN